MNSLFTLDEAFRTLCVVYKRMIETAKVASKRPATATKRRRGFKKEDK